MSTLQRTFVGVLNIAKIKSLRLRRKLSQAAAAKAAGVNSRQWWSDIEAGRKMNISLEVLGRIAGSLGVKPRELLLDESNPPGHRKN